MKLNFAMHTASSSKMLEVYNIQPQDTIAALKRQLIQKYQEQFQLYLDPRYYNIVVALTPPPQDHDTISQHNIQTNATIHCQIQERWITVTVQFHNKAYQCSGIGGDIAFTQLVGYIVYQLQSEALHDSLNQRQEELSFGQFILSKDGNILDHNRNIKDYGIVEGSHIQAIFLPFTPCWDYILDAAFLVSTAAAFVMSLLANSSLSIGTAISMDELCAIVITSAVIAGGICGAIAHHTRYTR